MAENIECTFQLHVFGTCGSDRFQFQNPQFECDPNFGRSASARERRIDHISFGISPWDTDGVRAELEKRGLVVTVDTSSAHPGPDGKMVPDDIHTAPFRSYHTRTPNGYNLQISWMTRDKRLNLANAVKPKALAK